MPLTKAELTRLRDLRDKRQREAAGLFVIEGEKVVGELLAAKYPLLEIYATPAWPAPSDDARVREVSVEDMARASHFPTPSTVLAVGRISRTELAAVSQHLKVLEGAGLISRGANARGRGLPFLPQA